MHQIIEKIMKNGSRLIVVPDMQSPSVMCAVLVSAGSAYETKKQNGISHFLEHLCFKGTLKRPRAIDIASELEGMGAHYNAFTDREVTGYYAKAAAEQKERIIEVIVDLYLNPTLQEAELEKEKGVIIEEINMYEDQPRSKVAQECNRLLYGDQPAGWDIAGTKENIRAISRSDVIKYREAFYHAKATTIILTGAITQKEAQRITQKMFQKIKHKKKQLPQKVKENKQKKIALIQRPLDQTHIVLGAKAMTARDSSQFILALAADILGGGMSSRLFQSVREELGIAYYVGSSTMLFGTHGYITISAGLSNEKAQKGIAEIKKQIIKLIRDGVSPQELARAKEHYIGSLLLSLETAGNVGLFYGEQLTSMGKAFTPKQIIDFVRSVTIKDVNRLSKQMLSPDQWSCALIGPHKNEKKFSDILSA